MVEDVLKSKTIRIGSIGKGIRMFGENNLKIKRSKCKFVQTEIDYLGYRVNEFGIRASRGIKRL